MKKHSYRKFDRRGVLSLGAITTMIVWHKPVVNSIILPAHAQTSSPNPADVCPMIVVGNTVLPGPPSGPGSTTSCQVTFDFLSSSPSDTLTINSITNTVVGANSTLSYDGAAAFAGPVTVSDLSGTRLSWVGPVVGGTGTCLSMPVPVDDITITVTATCAAAAGGEFNQDFLLSALLTP